MDGTFGDGGHSELFLKMFPKNVKLMAFDMDEAAFARPFAKSIEKQFQDRGGVVRVTCLLFMFLLLFMVFLL